MSKEKKDNVWYFLIAIIIPNAGGWVGAALWQDRDWFENQVQHPPWRPPNWLFPVVWTIIYSLMGIGSYYVFKHGEGVQKFWLPLGFYCTQLIVNWFWTPFFFTWQLILVALIDIVLLWVLVFITIILFWRTKRKAAIFLAPYITWVSVAVALNSHYYHLNKDL